MHILRSPFGSSPMSLLAMDVLLTSLTVFLCFEWSSISSTDTFLFEILSFRQFPDTLF